MNRKKIKLLQFMRRMDSLIFLLFTPCLAYVVERC